eukprot:2675678-Pleurochrysis_carterae.AAC.1
MGAASGAYDDDLFGDDEYKDAARMLAQHEEEVAIKEGKIVEATEDKTVQFITDELVAHGNKTVAEAEEVVKEAAEAKQQV